VEHFIQNGFVRIDGAFPRELADEARIIMWRDLPCDPHDRATWTRPVIRLSGYGEGPFRKQRTPLFYTPPSINWSAEADGFRATALEPSRCVSLIQTTLATPAGTSMSAFQATTATRTSNMISRHGGRTAAPPPAPSYCR